MTDVVLVSGVRTAIGRFRAASPTLRPRTWRRP